MYLKSLRPVVLALAGLKCSVALALLLLRALDGSPREVFLTTVLAVQVAVMAGTGLFLMVGGRQDRRAVTLGDVFVLIAAAFAPSGHPAAADASSGLLGAAVHGVLNLRVEFLVAPLVWQFVRDFPEAPLSFDLQRRLDHLLRAIWMLTGGLLVINLASLGRGAWQGQWVGGRLDPTHGPSLGIVMALCLGGLFFLSWKARRSAGDERRRSRLFLLAVVGGGVVFALATLVDLVWPGPRLYFNTHPTALVVIVVVRTTFLLAIPLATAYAVHVEQALDVRGIAHRALRHGLTRLVAQFLVALPFVALLVYLWRYRELSLAELFSVKHLLLAVIAVLSLAGLRTYKALLQAIDRHFFPEHYNAQRILEQLPHQIRASRDVEELGSLVGRAIGLAWQVERVSFLVRDPEDGVLHDPRGEVQPLDSRTELVEQLAEAQQPLEVDLVSRGAPFAALPERERYWLVDSRARLLCPAFAMDGGLNAILAIGPKPGGLPYVTEDRQALMPVVAAAGLVVELLDLKNRPPTAEFTDDEDLAANGVLVSPKKATECLACSQIFPPAKERCPRCQIKLQESTVPYALRRNFRFEERIGTGGMAVVFRATDIKLGRPVAIKTLPRVSPEAAERLQREARTAATVSHPGLAAIYGIETWEGIPMLILEYLEGGTLADRMNAGGSLSSVQVIDTGLSVAQALKAIHGLGILHRDIKPSNIGYTRHNAAKLLDFGIARIYEDLRQDPEDPSEVQTVEQLVSQTSEGVGGTICYFSPEAIDEAPPDPTFDLWGLSVVLYEALVGTNLFFNPRLAEMLDAIRAAEVPNLRDRIEDCPDELARFFELELHKDQQWRSRNAGQYLQRLRRVRRGLTMSVASSGILPRPA